MSETSEAAAFEYLRNVIENEDLTQDEVAADFGISGSALRRALRKIIDDIEGMR